MEAHLAIVIEGDQAGDRVSPVTEKPGISNGKTSQPRIQAYKK